MAEQQKQQNKARKEAETDKNAAHFSSEDLQCSKCDRRFRTATRCAIHVAWCNDDRKCNQCPNNTKYATDRALHRHWNFHHNCQGCSFCLAEPYSQDSEEHEREKHPGEFRAHEYKQNRHKLVKCIFCKVKLLPRDKEEHERGTHPTEFQAREYRREYGYELQECSFCRARLFPEDIEYHERKSHPGEFEYRQWEQRQNKFKQCSFCGLKFPPQDREDHERKDHPREFEARENHQQRPRDGDTSSSEERTSQESKSLSEVPSHYKTLGVANNASAAEILQAAKKMRILCHPDRLKRNGSTPEEIVKIDEQAKNVGWAADVLCNEESRRKYDRKVGISFH